MQTVPAVEGKLRLHGQKTKLHRDSAHIHSTVAGYYWLLRVDLVCVSIMCFQFRLIEGKKEIISAPLHVVSQGLSARG